MNRNLRNVEDKALVMHYYAYLNERDVVEAVVALPSVISDPSYIEISTNDQSLVGKKYNRETGKFEDIMFYYAVLDAKDIVVEVIALESQVTESNKIEIPTYDQSLVGKWYDREKGIFCELPIHILAKMNTGEINTLKADGSPADKWLHTELSDLNTSIAAVNTDLGNQISNVNTLLSTKISASETGLNAKISASETTLNGKISQADAKTSEVDTRLSTRISDVDTQLKSKITQSETALNAKVSEVDGRLGARISEADARLSNKIATVDSLGIGAYKARFDIRNNEELLESWVENGKTFTFNFDTGIPGYFPKMIRLVNDSDSFVCDLYIVKNTDGTIKLSYSDQEYLGVISGYPDVVERILRHGESNTSSNVFSLGRSNQGVRFDEGGSTFISNIPPQGDCFVEIGNFIYTENSLSFTVTPSSEMVGRYTNVKLRGYIH